MGKRLRADIARRKRHGVTQRGLNTVDDMSHPYLSVPWQETSRIRDVNVCGLRHCVKSPRCPRTALAKKLTAITRYTNILVINLAAFLHLWQQGDSSTKQAAEKDSDPIVGIFRSNYLAPTL